jgi:hypothetical protein
MATEEAMYAGIFGSLKLLLWSRRKGNSSEDKVCFPLFWEWTHNFTHGSFQFCLRVGARYTTVQQIMIRLQARPLRSHCVSYLLHRYVKTWAFCHGKKLSTPCTVFYVWLRLYLRMRSQIQTQVPCYTIFYSQDRKSDPIRARKREGGETHISFLFA